MIRIVLVDDHLAFRRALRMFLSLQPDLSVIGEAGDGAAALDLVAQLHPDVVLMDIAMPSLDGMAATAALRRRVPQTAVIVLSLSDDDVTIERARAAGAATFVSKYEAGGGTLPAVIRGVVARAHVGAFAN